MATLLGFTPRNESVTWRHVNTRDSFGKAATYTDTTILVNWSGKTKRLSVAGSDGVVREIYSSGAVITVHDLTQDDILIRGGINHTILEVREVQDDNGTQIERIAYV